MTDPTPRPDDELVSAVLDGEATADERARVEADPAARQRLAELQAARDLLARPVTVPPEAREAAIAAALALFDASTKAPADRGTAGPPPADRSAATVDDLAARRARRGGPGVRILAAAAAVVVVLLGAAGMVRLLNPPSELTAATGSSESADVVTSQRPSGGQASDNEPAPDAGVTTTAASTPGPTVSTTTPLPAAGNEGRSQYAAVITADLGAVGSTRDLRDRMLVLVDRASATDSAATPTTVAPGGSGTPTGPAIASFDSCASYLSAVDPELADLVAVGAATYQGAPTTVLAFRVDQQAHPAANGSVRIYAVEPTTCATVAVLTVR